MITLSYIKSHSLLPSQTCVIVRLVPKIQSVIFWFMNPNRSVSSQPRSILKNQSGYFQRKRRKSGYRFQTERKKPLIVVRFEVPAHRPTQRGISTHCFKKGGATPKKQSPTNSYTPFSTLTLIVPSILRNFQRTPTISQTWHAPGLIPAPGMWQRERDTFTGLSFFFPLNLGSEVTTVEKVEKEAVCHRKPCLQKSRILSQRDKQGKQLSVRSAVMFSARKYLQDDCLRCA